MKFITLFLLLFSVSGLCQNLDGVESPEKAVSEFMNSLKEGEKGMEKAFALITDLNGESRQYAERFKPTEKVDEALKKIIVDQKQGPVVEYKQTESSTMIQGNMIVQEYDIKFKGGFKRSIEFIFIRPTVDGNFHLMDVKLQK